MIATATSTGFNVSDDDDDDDVPITDKYFLLFFYSLIRFDIDDVTPAPNFKDDGSHVHPQSHPGPDDDDGSHLQSLRIDANALPLTSKHFFNTMHQPWPED